MGELVFKTNINCGNCVKSVTPHLDEAVGIDAWAVDTSHSNKWLKVHAGKDESTVIAAVEAAGFTAIPFFGSETDAPFIQPAAAPKLATADDSAFWKDEAKWKRAGFNTLNCLIGCSIGDFGAMAYMQINHMNMPVWQMMAVAMACGLATSVALETAILKVRESFNWAAALETALKMSFISMLVMELTENITDYLITGNTVQMHEPLYWGAIAVSMVAGFLVPLPYNYYKLKKYNKACH